MLMALTRMIISNPLISHVQFQQLVEEDLLRWTFSFILFLFLNMIRQNWLGEVILSLIFTAVTGQVWSVPALFLLFFEKEPFYCLEEARHDFSLLKSSEMAQQSNKSLLTPCEIQKIKLRTPSQMDYINYYGTRCWDIYHFFLNYKMTMR